MPNTTYTNKVNPGENLSTIAKNAGLTPEQFATLNPHLAATGSNSYQGLNNLVQVGTGYNLAPPTVVSNENKVTAANDIVNKQGTYQSGPVTNVDANGNTITTNADGSAYTPSEPPKNVVKGQGGYYKNVYYSPGSPMPTDANGNTVTLMDKPENYIDWNAMKAQFDATGVQQLANIEATYNNLIQQQQQANQSAEGNVKNALLQAGITGQGSSSQYAPVSSQGIITSQVNYGIQQIQTLNAQKQAAILAAQNAIQQGDFQYAEKAQAQADKIAAQQQAAMDKINNDLIEEQKKMAEQTAQANKDSAIVEQFNNGVTSTAQIITNLKKQGVNTTIDQVSTALKSLLPNTDTIKLGNGNTVLIDKATGKILNSYGGGGTSGGGIGGSTITPIIRTVNVAGVQQPVDGYTVVEGDDPYFIAQNHNITMNQLAKLNPDIKDWYNVQPGQVLNVPSKQIGEGSILSATGLSNLAFQYMTQGTPALTRLGAEARQAVIKEVEDYVNNKGVDLATFKSQYQGLSKTVEANVLRNNQAAVTESELEGTIENIKMAAEEANLQDLGGLNIAKIWAGKQLNKPEATTFKFHLEQLRKEYATYNAVLGGGIDQNGNVRELSASDYKKADELIQDGFAKGSIEGFEQGLKNSMDKMQDVLQNSIDAQNKQVWKLFGVEDIYPQKQNKLDTNTDPFLDDISSKINSSTKLSNKNFFESLFK